jgi:hypothetical protein
MGIAVDLEPFRSMAPAGAGPPAFLFPLEMPNRRLLDKILFNFFRVISSRFTSGSSKLLLRNTSIPDEWLLLLKKNSVPSYYPIGYKVYKLGGKRPLSAKFSGFGRSISLRNLFQNSHSVPYWGVWDDDYQKGIIIARIICLR